MGDPLMIAVLLVVGFLVGLKLNVIATVLAIVTAYFLGSDILATLPSISTIGSWDSFVKEFVLTGYIFLAYIVVFQIIYMFLNMVLFDLRK